ncbi:MAG: UDP-N-acetylmuramoyl-L-alanine--D-glutamate ligase [Anaerolineales bacterium]|nr:UDP-N-acetylmuramoyl-L-alanine--D-glutamate ligase [Anaerolineales bacterium]
MGWQGKRVLVVGAARQGLALARYLATEGASVVLNDQAAGEVLSDARRALADHQIEWVAGGHPLEVLQGVDLVCPSGGVPLDLPLIREAQNRGVPLSNDSQIFLDAAPCQVIGITGSAGKSTTTALIGSILSQVYPDTAKGAPKVWVGGNIGNPLITDLQWMGTDDLCVVELSSFQLELMTRSPDVAVVLNVTPNHLDRHESMDAYMGAKRRILDYQSTSDVAVLGRDDAGAWSFRNAVVGELVVFGFERPPEGFSGSFIKDGMLVTHAGNRMEQVMQVARIPVRGRHNVLNALAASAVALALDVPVEEIRAGIESFAGMPHRLEHIRSWRGAEWYNDSIATAPERTIAALQTFDPPIILLAGGRDKNLPWEGAGSEICRRVRQLIAFGEAASLVIEAVENASSGDTKVAIARCDSLRDATREAARLAEPGDTVLLAPGGTSFDEFKDFEERGEKFKQWVNELS